MNRSIVEFDRDEHDHWRAKLSCGHYQHVRHDPPLRDRKWVLTDEGRLEKLGALLECKKCESETSVKAK